MSKALKPKQYHMCWLSFTISHENEKNYFRVVEKHYDKYGSTMYMVLFMFCFTLSLEVWKGRLSAFLRHMVLFSYGKPVISTGGNIFLMEYIYRYYPAWSSLMLLLSMQQKPLFSWFFLYMRDCLWYYVILSNKPSANEIRKGFPCHDCRAKQNLTLQFTVRKKE